MAPIFNCIFFSGGISFFSSFVILASLFTFYNKILKTGEPTPKIRYYCTAMLML